MSVASVLPIIRGEMSRLHVPSAHDKVYKDECLYSFDSPFSDTGLYLNLATYHGVGHSYLHKDVELGGKLYLLLKFQQLPKKKDETEKKVPTKLAIGTEDGFLSTSQFDIHKDYYLVVVNGSVNSLVTIPLPTNELPEFVSNVIAGVISHEGMKHNLQVSAWDADNEKIVSKYAENLVQLPATKKIPQDPKLWKCEESGATNNLWLNLSTGYIGGGRKNWDGSGGSGSAITHYENTGCKYPLAVKLGTITPKGADVWSYAKDEDCLVIDPYLADHLSYWGIDIMKMEKTDKTLGEMEVSLNMSYDWSKIMEGSEKLEPRSGPGYVGLLNIGASCYLNSVMQSVLALPEVQERYLRNHEQIVQTSGADPASDFLLQLSKLEMALFTERYVQPIESKMDVETTLEESDALPTLEKYIIAPRLFKHLIGKNHPEFSTNRQQDASEYFTHFLDLLDKNEKGQLTRLCNGTNEKLTSTIFTYHMQTRYQCAQTGEVKYSKRGPATLYNMVNLTIPLEAATISSERDPDLKRPKLDEGESPDTTQTIPFEACLTSYFQVEDIEMFNPTLAGNTICKKTIRFETFPRYLMLKLERYYIGENWTTKKIAARIPVPEHLDLTQYEGKGLQEFEREMPDPDANTQAPVGGGPVFDAGMLDQLLSMGFTENGAKRSLQATGNNDVEMALAWALDHSGDHDFNDPVVTTGGANAQSTPGVDPDAIAMLTSMGYTEEQTMAALKCSDNNIERAADWLFSHVDDLDAAVAQALSAVDTASSAGSESMDVDTGIGKYDLMAVISHIGKTTDHGHYVCHVKRNGEWILLNDDKVGKCTKAPLKHGFMYLYRRVDGTGTLN